MHDRIKLSSPVGYFIFFPDCLLSHAKLVRDAVVSQVNDPREGSRPIKTPSDAYKFVRSCAGSFSETPFTFVSV